MKNLNDVYSKIKKEIYDPSFIKIDEKYKIITYPGVRKNYYMVSDLGNVYSIKHSKVMKQKYDDYLRIHLATDNLDNLSESKLFSVHRLVAWEFCDGYDPITGKVIVNHKNLCKYDNRASNLEWCDYSHNTRHEIETSDRYNNKRALTKEEFIKVCKLFRKGHTPMQVFNKLYDDPHELGIKYDARYSAISNIHLKRGYKELIDEYPFDKVKRDRKFSDEIIKIICSLFEEGMSSVNIYRKLVSDGTISECETVYRTIRKIKSKEIYRDISKNYKI